MACGRKDYEDSLNKKGIVENGCIYMGGLIRLVYIVCNDAKERQLYAR